MPARIRKSGAHGQRDAQIGRTKRSDGGFHPDANALWSIRTMANAGRIEIQSHGETIRGEYVVDHDGVVRLRSAIGEKGTRGRKAEARWLARRMLRELAHERALMRAQRS
jgi:hypothetical protein